MLRFHFVLVLTLPLTIAACDAPRKPSPGLPARSGPVSQTEIDNKIVKKDGVFRFVTCRASNISSLAFDRRDAMAVDDATRLLQERVAHCLAQFKEKKQFVGFEPEEEFVKEHEPVFRALAKTMSIEHTSSLDLENATAAYLIAEIQHDALVKALRPIIHDVAQRHSQSSDDESSLMQDLISALTVGWGGNRGRFAVEPWTDPAK